MSNSNHKQVSVAEFFEKNRHLLGFNNPAKALLTSVKEAVDNSLDACESSKILPDIFVKIQDMENDRYKLIVEDNGPGLNKKVLGKAFGSLLYGSNPNHLPSGIPSSGQGMISQGGSPLPAPTITAITLP